MTTRPVSGVIAVLSILLNATLCLVVMRKRSMLNKSYNILIFILAITDTLTGKVLFFPRSASTATIAAPSKPPGGYLGPILLCMCHWSLRIPTPL